MKADILYGLGLIIILVFLIALRYRFDGAFGTKNTVIVSIPGNIRCINTTESVNSGAKNFIRH